MLDNVQHVVLDTTICWASSCLLLLLDSNYDKSASNLRVKSTQELTKKLVKSLFQKVSILLAILLQESTERYTSAAILMAG